MAHRVGPRAETDLDDMKLLTNRLIDSITDCFSFLATFPLVGRALDEDVGAGSLSFAVGEYIIIYCVEVQPAKARGRPNAFE